MYLEGLLGADSITLVEGLLYNVLEQSDYMILRVKVATRYFALLHSARKLASGGARWVAPLVAWLGVTSGYPAISVATIIQGEIQIAVQRIQSFSFESRKTAVLIYCGTFHL